MMCPDNYDYFRSHDARQEKALICKDCIDDMKVKTENYMR